MPEEHTARRLAAILASDVVGYSRMMGADETGTLAALKRHRDGVFDPAVAHHNGRIVKLMGDGALVEFGSVVDAVNCALAVQKAVAGEAPAAGAKITLRIGINLGDVIIDGDDLYGDGVNVAARLEPLAEPGGICVSSIVNESVGGRVSDAFRDGGEVQVKNIDRPIRVWKWSPGGPGKSNATPAKPEAKPERLLPPSIAVLPFDNMSGDKEQEYFSDGITEDIITDLSRIGGLIVIARNSSFAYKGKSVDIRAVGRELGVRSVLEGSIRRAGNRVRITAQLIDAANGAHLWADRYDRDLTDVFALQDEVTRKIVDALKVTLTPGEQARIAETPTRSVEAHDLFLRARELLVGPAKDRRMFDEAVVLLSRAIALDPDFGEPHAGLAMAYNLDFHNRWTKDPDKSLRLAMHHADLAVEKAPDDPYGHYVASIVAGFLRDFDRADKEVETALALGPNFAMALNAKGAKALFSSRPLEAIPLIERAMRLDPAFAHQYLHFMGMAHLLTGKYETAVAEFHERVRLVPETDLSRAYLASALGHLGRADEARRVWSDLLRINPRYSFEDHMGRLPFRNLADTDRIREGLAKADLP